MIHIELEDAQIARLRCGAETVELVLSSAPSSRAGEDADTRPVAGYMSGIVMRLGAAHCQFGPGCLPGECVGAVQTAQLRRDGQSLRRLPVPAAWSGAFTLQLVLKNGTELQVQARRLWLDLSSDSRFTDSMAC